MADSPHLGRRDRHAYWLSRGPVPPSPSASRRSAPIGVTVLTSSHASVVSVHRRSARTWSIDRPGPAMPIAAYPLALHRHLVVVETDLGRDVAIRPARAGHQHDPGRVTSRCGVAAARTRRSNSLRSSSDTANRGKLGATGPRRRRSLHPLDWNGQGRISHRPLSQPPQAAVAEARPHSLHGHLHARRPMFSPFDVRSAGASQGGQVRLGRWRHHQRAYLGQWDPEQQGSWHRQVRSQ